MKKVLGIGNALVDVLITIENDDILNELNLPKGSMQLVSEPFTNKVDKAKIKSLKKVSGGSTANTVHGIANLGGEAGFVGKIGKDADGEFYRQDLIQNGITPVLFTGAAKTGQATAFISPDSERTFATYLGSAVELCADDLNGVNFSDYGIVHIEGYLVQNHELIEKACALSKKAGCLVALDLASYNVVEDNLEFLKKLAADYVDIIFANEDEAKAFTGLEPEEALNQISETCEIAVVKIGKQGSFIRSKGKTEKIKPLSANAVDTTGAGDLYAAGFLYGFVSGKTLAECGALGSLTSAKTVEVIGAKLSAEDWQKIKAAI